MSIKIIHILGNGKSGSSHLWQSLLNHPQVFRLAKKHVWMMLKNTSPTSPLFSNIHYSELQLDKPPSFVMSHLEKILFILFTICLSFFCLIIDPTPTSFCKDSVFFGGDCPTRSGNVCQLSTPYMLFIFIPNFYLSCSK